MNEVDIVPALKKKIDDAFKDLIEDDEVLSSCLGKLTDKSATWIDADTYAHQIGNLTSKALLDHVSSDILPGGTMYFNIGDHLVTPMLKTDYQKISDYCVAAQEALNEGANLAIKGQTAPFNADRAKGIVDRLSSQPFEDVEWLLKAPIEVFCDSVKADHLEANAKFHAKAGLSPKIIRRTDGKCCKWCSKLAGEYEYPDHVPADVFKKHENCSCTVEYDPADGSKKRQDVWSKLWKESQADIDKRQAFNRDNEKAWSSYSGLNDHFKRHAKDFGVKTVAEYTKKANDLWNAELSYDVVELEREDGTIVRYRYSTNELSTVDYEGNLTTYFKPNRGVSYWHEEKERSDIVYDSEEDD